MEDSRAPLWGGIEGLPLQDQSTASKQVSLPLPTFSQHLNHLRTHPWNGSKLFKLLGASTVQRGGKTNKVDQWAHFTDGDVEGADGMIQRHGTE